MVFDAPDRLLRYCDNTISSPRVAPLYFFTPRRADEVAVHAQRPCHAELG